MRQSLTLLVLFLACSYSLTAQTKTDRERAGLIGPVRTVRQETARVSDVSGQTVEVGRVLVQSLGYDAEGSATDQIVLNPDGSTKRKLGWGHTYDAKGRESEKTYVNADGVITMRAVAKYDEKGHKVEVTFSNGGRVNHVETFYYDDAGKLIREVHLNPDGSSRNTQTYTYDSRARLTEWIIREPDGTLAQRKASTYDEKDRETEFIIYPGEKAPSIGQKHSYDKGNNLVENLQYRNGVLVGRETFTYEFDARGNWVKRRFTKETIKDGTSQTEIEVNYRTITFY